MKNGLYHAHNCIPFFWPTYDFQRIIQFNVLGKKKGNFIFFLECWMNILIAECNMVERRCIHSFTECNMVERRCTQVEYLVQLESMLFSIIPWLLLSAFKLNNGIGCFAMYSIKKICIHDPYATEESAKDSKVEKLISGKVWMNGLQNRKMGQMIVLCTAFVVCLLFIEWCIKFIYDFIYTSGFFFFL